MTNLEHLSIVVAFAGGSLISLVGCVGNPPPVDDGSGGNAGSGSAGTGSDGAPQTHDATGSYQLTSTFDLSSNVPGTVGVVIDTFIDATDDSADPTKWILEHVIAAMPDGVLKTVLSDGAPFVEGYLNDQLLAIAPGFVTTILQVGKDFGDMAKHTGLISTLDVTASGSSYTSVHTVTGAHFTVEGVDSDFLFMDYGLQDTVVPGVGVGVDATGKMSILQHRVPVSYGAMLRIGLDNAIVPSIDPGTSNLDELLHDQVDCAVVGQTIADAVHIGDPSVYEAACNDGLDAAADLIYSQIASIDGSALEFDISGQAATVDLDNDGTVDNLEGGTWAGTTSYAGSPAPLALATFTGTRL